MYSEHPPLLCDGQVSAAGDLLISAREGGIVLGELPAACRPMSHSDSQRIIDYVYERRAIPASGWKIYFPYKPRVAPVVTPIYDVFLSGKTIERNNTPRLIEAELVFQALTDLRARRAPYRFEEAAAAFRVMPAFEVLRTRYLAEPLRTQAFWPDPAAERSYAYEMFADNTVNDCFIVGEACESWSHVDFTTMPVSVCQDGYELGSSVGGHPLQDPFLAVVAGLNFMRHRGGIRKGQIVATTSVTDFFEVSANSGVIGDFGSLGRVSASFR